MSATFLELKKAVEAAILGSEDPVSLRQLLQLFSAGEEIGDAKRENVEAVLEALRSDCKDRGVELVEVASGYRYQVKRDEMPWVRRLTSRRPPRYSRALLETLAIIAYRQPVTRATIADIRGVEVSYRIMRALMDRGWVREVGRLDAPGNPALFSTTQTFLDYFNLKSLQELPELDETEDLPAISGMGSEDETPSRFEEEQAWANADTDNSAGRFTSAEDCPSTQSET